MNDVNNKYISEENIQKEKIENALQICYVLTWEQDSVDNTKLV